MYKKDIALSYNLYSYLMNQKQLNMAKLDLGTRF